VRPFFYVMFSPVLDDEASLFDRRKPVLIEAEITKLPVERLYEGVLRRLPWLDEEELHVVHRCPPGHGAAHELWAIVGDDDLGFSAGNLKTLENACDI